MKADFPINPSLINARYVIPVRPAGVVLENHSVILDGERIADLLPIQQARMRYEGCNEVNLDDHVLLPGLINMHTHSPMTLMRGLADDMGLHQWLSEHIWPIEKRFVSEEFVADGTLLAIAEMIRAGTTCFNDNYFFPNVMARIARKSGIRACIGLPVIEMPTAWAGSVEECFEKGLDLLSSDSKQALLTYSWAPHAPYSVSDDTFSKLAELCDENALPLHLHLLETSWDIEHSMREYGVHPIERLRNLNILNSRLLAVHMTQLSAGDVRTLRDHGVHVIHCPQSNLKLGNGICPVSDLQRAGINVSLGTDGAASNNNLDMLAEAQTAALLAKGSSGDARVVDAFCTLEMLTINGAKALQMEHKIGSIEVGKSADLAALDLNAPETQPLYNVTSQLIYSASSRQFSDVWVAGRHVLEQGELKTIDLDGLLGTVESWRARVSAALSKPAV